MTNFTVTLGADPEFFVTKHGGDTFIPACGLFGGEKGHPTILSDDGGFLEDGCAVEFNVRPAETIHELAGRIRSLKALFVKKFDFHWDLYSHAHASFDKKELKKHPSANVIGCGGDLAAWGVRMPPDIGLFGDNRFAGGHIHVGIDPWPEHITRGDIIRFLDLTVLLPNIKEQNARRMKFYGSPGIYRETSYGVEWRSPDPQWTGGGGGFIRSFDIATLYLRAILANKEPVPLARIVGETVAKSELLEYLQEVPFRPDHHNLSWKNIGSQIEDRIRGFLEGTPESVAISKMLSKTVKPNRRYINLDAVAMPQIEPIPPVFEVEPDDLDDGL